MCGKDLSTGVPKTAARRYLRKKNLRGVQTLGQCPVLIGVPQGSVLGPLLYLININLIGPKLNGTYKIFADDLELYACVRHVSREYVTVSPGADEKQRDIEVLHKTSTLCLNINGEKCAVLKCLRKHHNMPQPCYLLNGAPVTVCETHR